MTKPKPKPLQAADVIAGTAGTGTTTYARVQPVRGTKADWAAANPVLLAGEDGYETDTGAWKKGNGSSTWSALPYQNVGAVTSVQGRAGAVVITAADIGLGSYTPTAQLDALIAALITNTSSATYAAVTARIGTTTPTPAATVSTVINGDGTFTTSGTAVTAAATTFTISDSSATDNGSGTFTLAS